MGAIGSTTIPPTYPTETSICDFGKTGKNCHESADIVNATITFSGITLVQFNQNKGSILKGVAEFLEVALEDVSWGTLSEINRRRLESRLQVLFFMEVQDDIETSQAMISEQLKSAVERSIQKIDGFESVTVDVT